jgi:hypothetical protein
MLLVQCKMARVEPALGLRELAELSRSRLRRFPASKPAQLKLGTVGCFESRLGIAGIEFVPENCSGAAVRLRTGGRTIEF